MPRKDATQLQRFRDQIQSRSGSDYWRSLEELAGSEEFQQYLQQEFSEGADQFHHTNRRQFLTLMGASLALAGLAGCGQPQEEKIVPYVDQPEQIVPGKPLFYATAMVETGLATGLIVESHMGRPTKIEGNPKHPSVPPGYWGGDDDLRPGASDIFAQAAILGLYDPDRSQTVTHDGQIGTWDAFLTVLKERMALQKSAKGRGVRLLTETVTSPTLAQQIADFLEIYPEAKWHQFEPVNRDAELAGAKLAFGEYRSAHFDVQQADVIVSLDADFLISGPEHLQHARHFADGRMPPSAENEFRPMNRLYMLESSPTLTGAKADHRLPLSPAQIEHFAEALAAKLGVEIEPSSNSKLSDLSQKWLDAIVSDLKRDRSAEGSPASLIMAGTFASPRVHALVHAMNHALGNNGKTVNYSEPVEADPNMQWDSLSELVSDMNSGSVEALFILGGNPVYNTPADVHFAEALDKVPFRVRLGQYEDETSARCDWHVPEAHFLESWSDARAANGTVTILQPLIAPLYQGKTSHEFLSVLAGKPGRSSLELVKDYWRQNLQGEKDFETIW